LGRLADELGVHIEDESNLVAYANFDAPRDSKQRQGKRQMATLRVPPALRYP
jgi:hypothetical protein